MTISIGIATRGHETFEEEAAASGPQPSCIALTSVVGATVTLEVIPPPDVDYDGSLIQYGEVGTCVYSEAGPESGGFLTISGLTAGTIYAFIPVSFDTTGNIGKPGNIILATTPINIIDMDQLALNTCGLEDIWTLIGEKVNSRELQLALRNADIAIQDLALDRRNLHERITRLQAEVAALRRKL